MLASKQKIFENTADAYYLRYVCNQPELWQAQLEAYFWTIGKNHDSLDEYRLCRKRSVLESIFIFQNRSWTYSFCKTKTITFKNEDLRAFSK